MAVGSSRRAPGVTSSVSILQSSAASPLDRLTGDPPAGDVVKLANTDEWRLRVGDWRIRFERDAETGVVHVIRVLPRGRAYRD
jgi:mRNA-degrading endonuclease RelE of RelBE toxin-antitoxin system